MVDEYIAKLRPELLSALFRFLYGRWIRERFNILINNLIKFRFLYGRWIPLAFIGNLFVGLVQIPLWSMNTQRCFWSQSTPTRSDSSMVDEYQLTQALGSGVLRFRFLYGRWILQPHVDHKFPLVGSDSSMVDEYQEHQRQVSMKI